MNQSRLVRVTGATGYTGGRLVPQLLEAGYQVRCLVGDAKRLQGRTWIDQVEVVERDTLKPETLAPAMEGVWAVHYFVHCLTDTEEYRQRDRSAARNFGRTAKEAGIEHLLYLGGLGDPEAKLLDHLRSRQETGAALAETELAEIWQAEDALAALAAWIITSRTRMMRPWKRGIS